MFDIGFTELIVIGVVALIVIGPERLPKVARTAGHLYGRLQRYVSSVKSDISQEIQLDEIRRAGQEFKDSIESAVAGAEQQATVVDDYLRNEVAEAERTFTRWYDKDERILKHRKDTVYGSICRFFDTDQRRCTVYEARPAVCRDYPSGSRCG